jgi:hypothetical protein
MARFSIASKWAISQLVKVLTLHLYATCVRVLGFLYVLFVVYPKNLSFALTDLRLFFLYILKNPYHYSRAFHRKNLYGETPLRTFDRIAKQSRLLSEDIAFEVGAGTGRLAFWMHHHVSCQVIAIEHIPSFVEKAKYVQKKRELSGVTFLCQDALNVDFQSATWIYFYGTARESRFVQKLIQRWKLQAPKAKIISTSYPLSDYDEAYASQQIGLGQYPWGKTPLYINTLAI